MVVFDLFYCFEGELVGWVFELVGECWMLFILCEVFFGVWWFGQFVWNFGILWFMLFLWLWMFVEVGFFDWVLYFFDFE